MPRSGMVFLGVSIALTILAYFAWKFTARSAYEAAEYKVIESEGAFEIREYPDLVLATTTMQFQAQGNDGSFGRLFNYISGKNETQQKIAMTVPVFMETDAQRENGQMGFVLPKKVAAQTAPSPAHEKVELKTRSGGKFVVVRFTGRINQETVASQEANLRQWMQTKGLAGEGPAEVAGYDPPWTPGPLRRNEVLIRVQ